MAVWGDDVRDFVALEKLHGLVDCLTGSILQRQSASENYDCAKKSLTTLTRASSSFVRREVRLVPLAFAISGVNDDAERV